MEKSCADYWNKVAKLDNVNWHIAHIDDEYEFYLSGHKVVNKIFEELESIPLNSKVLEIGCGKGRIIKALSKMRPDFILFGVDVSESMISQAYSDINDHKIFFSVTNGSDLKSFPQDFFDYVYSYIVFQHLPRSMVKEYCIEVLRVLKPGGYFIFQVQGTSTPQDNDPPDNDFRKIRYYTQQEAIDILPKGMSFIRFKSTLPSEVRWHDLIVESKKD